jgi:hypothetical protein
VAADIMAINYNFKNSTSIFQREHQHRNSVNIITTPYENFNPSQEIWQGDVKSTLSSRLFLTMRR